ncbi:hypothetical protein K1719_013307 [Acacia pycnantha]|nr:hypothetical protein K1719_013307 [Acacia pycnantha]
MTIRESTESKTFQANGRRHEVYTRSFRFEILHSSSPVEKIADVDHVNGSNGKCHSKPGLDSDKKISPLATLGSSFEPLNVKKFDVAITVDPLYHQTSLLFDEGGIKCLLMNNLGTYGGCCLLFDSSEVPGKYKSYSHQIDTSDRIDLSFAKESIERW